MERKKYKDRKKGERMEAIKENKKKPQKGEKTVNKGKGDEKRKQK